MAQLRVAANHKLRTTAFEVWEWETYGCGVTRPLRVMWPFSESGVWLKISFFCLFPINHSAAVNFYKQKCKIYNRHLIFSQCLHKLILGELLRVVILTIQMCKRHRSNFFMVIQENQ